MTELIVKEKLFVKYIFVQSHDDFIIMEKKENIS